MKRIILSGGGTGGHIYPAITIAREILKIEEAEILFIGTPDGMESKIIPEEGFAFASIPVSGLKRKITFDNIKILMQAIHSLFKAKAVLNKFKPDIVIGTGGYVCGPILMAAALSRIPTLIQEQNVIPGITNKILNRVVDKVALGYEEARIRFPKPEKCIYTGNPIRPDVVSAQRAESRRKLGISPEVFMVVITGGSRGARTINRAMISVHEHFKRDKGICLYHITGNLEYDKIVRELGLTDGKSFGKGSRIIKYEYDMPAVLAAADLIICRAGAVSLAELAARELPSILIPYPYASGDHQTFNARVFVKAEAAKMIADKYVTEKELIQDINDFRHQPETLERMSEATKKIKKIYAGSDIAQLALEMTENKK